MKRINETATAILTAVMCICACGNAIGQVIVSPPNYTLTTPDGEFEYLVNGTSSGKPAQEDNVDDSVNFTLNAGATYIFQMNTSTQHPVVFCTSTTPTKSSLYSGASKQIVNSGMVTLTIPATNYPKTLYYICNNHLFYGIISVKPPNPPPLGNILGTSVTTNIVLTFTGGTNTVPLVPQFSSNLLGGSWLTVPAYTNTFSGNGTNTAAFQRLDAICGPDVFLRITEVTNQ